MHLIWQSRVTRKRLFRCCLSTCQLALLLAVVNAGQAPAATESLAVIVNPQVPVTALSGAELASIFTRTTKTWKDGTSIRPLNMQQGSPERIEFDRVVLAMSPERSAQYWLDKEMRGEEGAPKGVSQWDIMVRLVPTLNGGIGYVPEFKVDAKVRVVARIRGGRVLPP